MVGTTSSPTGAGVHGYNASNTNNAKGVFGLHSGSSGEGYGVLGQTYSAAGWGVYSQGKMGASGTKSAVVPTSQGSRELYAQESPEVWFEDFGEGKLSGGLAHVDLDPLFLETVTINDEHPLKVFIQLNDDCNGVYVQRQATSFDVLELQNGNSSAHFTYRVVAKRKGYEKKRLVAVQDPAKHLAKLKLEEPKK